MSKLSQKGDILKLKIKILTLQFEIWKPKVENISQKDKTLR